MMELPVGKNITLEELDLWKKTHCTIIGLKKKNNNYLINPSPGHTISKGDRLIVMGSDEQIVKAGQLVEAG